jgi:hypothetical protein
MNIKYDGLPGHMVGGIRRYIEHGIQPGSFLKAVLRNDFMAAFERADDMNIAYMHTWAMFLYNNAPGNCWGSPAAYDDWIARGGLNLKCDMYSG